MSHFTRVNTRITDLEALSDALYQLDFKVIHQARVRGWEERFKTAALVARFHESLCPYDIGFQLNPKTQAFDMVADWWAIQEKIGRDQPELVDMITQRYAYAKVVKEVSARGFVIAEEARQKDQSIRLVVRKW